MVPTDCLRRETHERFSATRRRPRRSSDPPPRTGIRLGPALALVAPCLSLGLAAQGRRAQIVSPALRGGDASKRSCRSQLCDRAAEPAGRWSIRRPRVPRGQARAEWYCAGVVFLRRRPSSAFKRDGFRASRDDFGHAAFAAWIKRDACIAAPPGRTVLPGGPSQRGADERSSRRGCWFSTRLSTSAESAGPRRAGRPRWRPSSKTSTARRRS